MYDIHDSLAWRLAYSSDGPYSSEYRSISFAFNTDGFNPYSQNRVSYSMWPIILTVLNLPRKIRYSFGNFWLVGTIPGNGTKEPKSLDPYLSVLVDELISLTNKQVFDSYQNAPFAMKVDILLYILDYKAIGKVFNLMGPNAYQACAWCELQGTYCSELHKMVYLQNRRFLPTDSVLRSDTKQFPSKTCEIRDAPPTRDLQTVKDCHRAYDLAPTKKAADAIAKSTGCKNSYCFMKLPNHNRLVQAFPDAMHTIKDSIERVFFILIGKTNLDKIVAAELAYGRFGFSVPSRKRKRGEATSIPKVKHPYVLSAEDLKVADARSKAIVMTSKDFNPGTIFFRTTGMKSHDWKELVSKNILKFCLRGMLQDQQRNTLFRFLDALRHLLAECISEQSIPQLQIEMNEALALMERDFPIDIQVIIIHILHHITEGIKCYGPVYATWMFAYERFNSWLHRRVMNRRYPEATLMETYRIFEWCQYMVMSGKCIITDYDPSTTSTREESLCDNVFSLLLDVYRKDIPRYGALTEEYKLNLKKAENARRKSSFPDMKNWIPSGGLKDGDLELLQGPTNCAIVNERLVIENVNTGRLVTYAAFDGDLLRPLAEVRCSFSFIRIITDEDLPTFARIKMCLSHTFAGSSHKLLLVYPFPIPQLDAESNIWWVSFDPNQQEEPDKAVILPVTSVSPPIVVAWEGGKLWFLDV